MELPVRVLKDVLSSDMDGHVLTPRPLVHSLQLLAEVATLHVKVQDADVVDQDGKGSLGEVDCGLTEDLVQHIAMHLWKNKEV